MSAASDALRFFELLYGDEPAGQILLSTPNGKGMSTHAVRRPSDAVAYATGNVDVFHRVTTVEHKPKGRGTEADTFAITALYQDVDVNGSPKGNGETVTGAAPTPEAAVELLHSVCEPSFLVNSGYGVHGYHRLREPWLLRTEEDRAEAKRLLRGWHARLKQEGKALGVANLDSTFDLARLLRPVGSLNGKGTEPRLVQLLDDGGPLYALEDLAGEVVEPESTPPADAGTGIDASVEEVLGRHEDLAKIVARKVTKPGKGSDSEWDFALGCRAAEHGYSDEVLGALFRHNRKVNPDPEKKAERDDYIERTIAAVRRRVGYVAVDSTPDVVLAELTKACRLDIVRRRAVKTKVAGHGNSASASIILDNGYAIEFDQFAHIAQPDKLANQLATTVALATEFSKLQARRIASLVRLAASRVEELHEREIYIDEAMKMLRLAQIVDFTFDTQQEKWAMWQYLEATDPEQTPEGPQDETSAQRRNRERKDAEAYARRMLIARDLGSGVRFVQAGWLQQYMRLRLGPSSTPQKTRQAMLNSGWGIRGSRGRIKANDPASDDELTLFFYLVPKDWEVRQ